MEFGPDRRRVAAPLVALAVLLSLALPARAAEVVVEHGITYRVADGHELQLDLARPAGEGPFPAIVFIHGGGWQGGQRQMYEREIRAAAERGYVAATVSYRLTQPDKERKAKYPFPTQVSDVKCAVRWLRAHAEEYRIDPERIGATGASAGGHLSLMLGLTDPDRFTGDDCDVGAGDATVQAVVNVFGPTDMARLYETSQGAAPIAVTFLGGSPSEAAEAYTQSSPITHVDRDDPPVLSIHGTADMLVPPDQAERLDRAMDEAGASHTLLLLDGEGHGFRGDANATARTAMYDFFDEHLKPSK